MWKSAISIEQRKGVEQSENAFRLLNVYKYRPQAMHAKAAAWAALQVNLWSDTPLLIQSIVQHNIGNARQVLHT